MLPDRALVSRVGILFALALTLAGREPAFAQSLPLRRDVPAPTPAGCPEVATFALPAISSADRQEAARLATEASNAAILGDHGAARDLLARAASRDPTAPHIAFRFGRTLEELGEAQQAVAQYCRYMELAGTAPDADEVRAAVQRLAPARRVGIPDSAVALFHTALASADAGNLTASVQAFTAVIAAAPTWSTPYHNRAIIRAVMLQHEVALADFEAFVQREPDSSLREAVRGWMTQLAEPPTPRYSAGTAFISGLLPGAGHFYTGRPIPGLLVLAGAGGAIAFGVLSQTHHVDCLTIPQNGSCPPDQVLTDRVERPYMMAGIGAAAAVSLLGAIDAALGARRKNARIPRIRFDANNAEDSASILAPGIRSNGSRLDLALIRLQF